MQIELIDYTGAGHPDPDYAAKLLVYTKNTRLEQGEETRNKIASMSQEELADQLDYIANTIRSSWEFIDYTFEIRGVTRAFTHQFVRTRTGSYAQQTHRGLDLSKGFDHVIPDALKGQPEWEDKWDELMDRISEFYSDVTASGFSPQDARAALPTNVSTNIIAKFNLRTMADLVGKRKNLRAQGEYGRVALAMAEHIERVHPWASSFLSPERSATPNLDGILKEALGERCAVEDPRLNAALKELDKLKGIWG